MSENKTRKKKLKSRSKTFYFAVSLGSIILLYFIFILFAPNISKKTEEKSYLLIPDNSSLENVIDSLKQNANLYTEFYTERTKNRI